MKTLFYRKQNVIQDVALQRNQTFPSINKAKKASRALQSVPGAAGSLRVVEKLPKLKEIV